MVQFDHLVGLEIQEIVDGHPRPAQMQSHRDSDVLQLFQVQRPPDGPSVLGFHARSSKDGNPPSRFYYTLSP